MGFSTQQSNNSGGYFILIPTEAPLGRKRNGEVFQPYHFKIKPGPFVFFGKIEMIRINNTMNTEDGSICMNQ